MKIYTYQVEGTMMSGPSLFVIAATNKADAIRIARMSEDAFCLSFESDRNQITCIGTANDGQAEGILAEHHSTE